MSELKADPEGLRDGAVRASASADELAAPVGFSASGDHPSHKGLATFGAAIDAATRDASAFLSRQSEVLRGGARTFEGTDHSGKGRFDGLAQ